jgi:hypothetical protein
MKTYLQGMTVVDSSSPSAGRKVEVWYRLPEQEQRERTYPYVAIDLIDIVEANGRAMVNHLKLTQLPYTPPDPLPDDMTGKTLTADRPVPVDIHYQVMAVARSARHDRQLQAQLWRKFPGKWGALYVQNDETARTMQMMGRSTAYDVDEFGKRTFRTMYTVSIASELWPTVIKQVQNLTEINIGIAFSADPSLVLSALDCHE